MADIFPTYYRANTPGTLTRLASNAGLDTHALAVFNSLPMWRTPEALTWTECWWIRLTNTGVMARFRSNMVGCLCRPRP